MTTLAFLRNGCTVESMVQELPSDYGSRLGLRTDEVAALFGVSVETVALWCRNRALPATRFGKVWLVDIAAVRQRFASLSRPDGGYR
jgi:excisionase family DNA binding protein